MAGFESNQVRALMPSQDGLVLVTLEGNMVFSYALVEVKKAPVAFQRERSIGIIDALVNSSYRRKGAGEALFFKVYD